MRHRLALVIAILAPLSASAQTQIKPRVMIMVDTSGSMQDGFATGATGGDGSNFYKDSLITRSLTTDFNLTPYLGAEVSPVTNQCTPATNPPAAEIYNGFNSRLFAAKAAVTNVLNGSGDVEWGLEKYTSDTTCTVFTHTLTPNAGGHPALGTIPEPPGRCTKDSDCLNGKTCDLATNRCHCNQASLAADCGAGNWSCTAVTGGLCAPGNNAACGTFGNRSGNLCVCHNDAICGNGLCANNLCNCSGACGASGCDTVNRACVNPCTSNAQCVGVCSGGNCGTLDDFFPQACATNGDCSTGQTCSGGKCTCAHDDDCENLDIGLPGGNNAAQVCFGGTCGIDLNWCWWGGERETSHRNSAACGSHAVTIGGTYNGTCGTSDTTANTAPCNTKQVCYVNGDCGSGACVKVAATDPMGECSCTLSGQCRNGDYTCTGNRCIYNRTCQSIGADILVDPASAGYSPAEILLWANGREDLTSSDPELRAAGSTPLAGAARSATAWYNAIKAYSLINGTSAACLAGTDPNPLCDPKILCRPYALVQMTDGQDTCENEQAGGDDNEGPVAAAGGFVDATPTGARVANKVYVIGLAANATLQGILNTTAQVGGTTQAAFANNQSDIEKALADIIVSSVLVEKCNYIDDDCNNISDDPFPDVNTACGNGAVGHCAANGKFKCSTDQLSEACGPVSCRNGAGSGLTFVDATHMRLNGVSGFTAADVNQFISIVSSRLPANRGTFQITATTATSVTYANNKAGTASETFPAGFEIYCTPQTSCRGDGNGGPLTQAGNSMTLAGVSGFTAADVGDAVTISGATNTANNGTFAITAQSGTTVTFTNPNGAPQAAGAITWAVDCRSPSCERGSGANFANKDAVNGRIDLTGGSGFVAGDVGKTITIRAAAKPGNVGNFTIQALLSPTSVRLNNANGAVESTNSVLWNLYCANAESLFGCNNFDDDCNGIPDDCTEGVAGSCCSSSGCLPVELCNGLDDDCDGVIDNNPVDVGATCGNSVGDCAPGVVRCCNVDPSLNGGVCPSPGPNDKPYCVGGNPGFPTTTGDLCDGTDDNCDGIPNGVPPRPCFNDPGASPNPFPAGLAGHGICQAGSQNCTTAPLPPGNAGCPAGWPAASPCPNPVQAFGACVNAVGPHREVCNGLDDDCNDIPDDNVSDSWVGSPCCPTGNLNDCTNTNGGMGLGTRCQMGMLACQGGGQVCVGGVAKSPEICDGIDNDCNGIPDDVAGLGATCTANGALNSGACHATFVCVVGSPGMCDGVPCPNGLTCNQTGTPSPEVCNGIDDDCNNVIDDPDEVAVNDPALMMPCDVPAPPNDKPPCMAGTPFCINGAVQCMGAVTPTPNICGQAATDCTGNPSMNCPSGSMCFQGNCVTECGAGEFPCPGGFVCDRTQMPPLCIPDACLTANCPAGSNCVVGSDGKATCTDPCAGVMCGAGFRCSQGACVDDTCNTFGCPGGQTCIGSPPSCVADPCASIECDTTQYCDNGNCVPLCETCLSGDRCVAGMCEADPCAGVHCSAGKVCAVTGGVGMCVTNMCLGVTCGVNQVCCGGACNNDPCKSIKCPDGIVCAVDSTCNATCSAPASPSKNQIVGAGGGGFSCSMGGHDDQSRLWPLLLLLLLLAVRRREVR